MSDGRRCRAVPQRSAIQNIQTVFHIRPICAVSATNLERASLRPLAGTLARRPPRARWSFPPAEGWAPRPGPPNRHRPSISRRYPLPAARSARWGAPRQAARPAAARPCQTRGAFLTLAEASTDQTWGHSRPKTCPTQMLCSKPWTSKRKFNLENTRIKRIRTFCQ